MLLLCRQRNANDAAPNGENPVPELLFFPGEGRQLWGELRRERGQAGGRMPRQDAEVVNCGRA